MTVLSAWPIMYILKKKFRKTHTHTKTDRQKNKFRKSRKKNERNPKKKSFIRRACIDKKRIWRQKKNVHIDFRIAAYSKKFFHIENNKKQAHL